MRFLKNSRRLIFAIALLLGLDFHISEGQAQWHLFYRTGLQAMERGDWNRAIESFQQALRVKTRDSKKIRAAGVMFIEYFPHRETGICYFHLGDFERARKELSISMVQEPSDRARNFLGRINRGERASAQPETPPNPQPATATPPPRTEPPPSTLVGERLSIAVLPFESKGIGGALGQIDLLDKLVTGFVGINRFKVIERAQLEKVLEEQKLGMSGIVDASTAAQIGKGIGVDGVVCGSITQVGNAVTIDARLIDTETAAIITAKDAYSNGLSLQNLSQMISDLAARFKTDLPLVNGYVINVQGEKVTVDLGLKNGIKKGMKCHVYREGSPIIHPVTGEVLGKNIDELCEVQITDVFDAYALATITKSKNGAPTIRDKVITK